VKLLSPARMVIGLSKELESRMQEARLKAETDWAKITGRLGHSPDDSGSRWMPSRPPRGVYRPVYGGSWILSGISAGCLLNWRARPNAVPRSIPPWPWQTRPERSCFEAMRGTLPRERFWWEPVRGRTQLWPNPGEKPAAPIAEMSGPSIEASWEQGQGGPVARTSSGNLLGPASA